MRRVLGTGKQVGFVRMLHGAAKLRGPTIES
jgi:hypothetical protein